MEIVNRNFSESIEFEGTISKIYWNDSDEIDRIIVCAENGEEAVVYNQGILDDVEIPIYLRRKIRVTGTPELIPGKRKIIRLGTIEALESPKPERKKKEESHPQQSWLM